MVILLSRYFLFVGLLLVSLPCFAGTWIDTKTHNNIVYFLYDSPAVLKRYDLTNQEFLPDLELSINGETTAFAVDEDGIFVGFGKRVSRYDLSGSNEAHLADTSHDIAGIVTSEFTIYVQNNDNLDSISKSDDRPVESVDYFYSMQGLSYSRENDRLYARNINISPSDILYMHLPDDGSLPPSFSGQVDSPYHGDYPSADQTFLFPGESKVVDSAGIVYAALDLTYLGSFAGAIDDISFYFDLPIVLRGREIISYNNVLIETGSFEYDAIDVQNIEVFEENVFGFYEDDTTTLSVAITSIDDLDPAEPGQAVDPAGLVYTPDNIIVGDDGIAYILSISNQSIFRWSFQQQQYLPSIPLLNVPRYMAHSAENQSLYIAYATGQINQIPLDENFLEMGLINLPQTPLGLSTAGEFIFAVDGSGAWESHFVFNSLGELISQQEWNYRSQEFIWNPVNRRIYHFRDGTSPNDLHWEAIDENGVIGARGDSPDHSSQGIKYPIRVAPNGATVVLGSGRIYDGLTLDQLTTLSNDIDDAVWHDGKLFTLLESTEETVLQEWSPENSYLLDNEQTLTGIPIRLLQAYIDDSHWLTVVSDVDGVPTFRAIDMGDNLDVDQDTINNIFDNCIYTSNVDQQDENFDGIGDACQNDIDNDAVDNDFDNCATLPNPDQLNSDDDLLGDACDRDDDNDNLLDEFDNCPLRQNLDQLNTDGDSAGDVCDSDQDNDGVLNGADTDALDPFICEDADFDSCDDCSIGSDGFGLLADNDILNDGLDTNSDGQCDLTDDDDDGDTVSDESDNCPLVVNLDQKDTDEDGVGDLCDAQDDNEICFPIKMESGAVMICL